MGYDMVALDAPGFDDPRIEALTARSRAINDKLGRMAASPERDALDDELAAVWNEIGALRGTFRLNIWGMGECRNRMEAYGMLTWPPRGSAPRYPDPAAFMAATDLPRSVGACDEESDPEELDPDGSYPEGSAERAWQGAVWVWLSSRRGAPGGVIAGHKLCSNDGWHVTPDEIRASLAAYEASPLAKEPDANAEWWPRWIDYLRRMADRGGFRVW